MDDLKKHGFTIGVVAMVVILLGFTYFFVMDAASTYGTKERGLKVKEGNLRRYAAMKAEDLPTKELVTLKTTEKESREGAGTAGEDFYTASRDALQKLVFEQGGQEYTKEDVAGISNAYRDALRSLNEQYLKLKQQYVQEVYQAWQLKQLQPEDLKFSAVTPTPPPSFESDEDIVHAAERCRITRSIFKAATAANWGGITHIEYERKKRSDARTKAKSKRKSTRKSKRRRGKEPEKEIKPIDPRKLYDKIQVEVAGEIRFQDLGPFLRNLYLQAQDATDPVLFLVEGIHFNKQEDRLLDPVYISEESWMKRSEAEQAPIQRDVRIPTATLRLTVNAVRWKGFPAEEEEES